MEAFGRGITVFVAAFSLVVLSIYSKTAPLQRQKNETVRSLTAEYVAELLEERCVQKARKERFLAELAAFGTYEAELTIYERRRYENEEGRMYLYAEWEGNEEEKRLASGSYLRLFVAEQKRSKTETFLYGEGCTIVAGGRVP